MTCSRELNFDERKREFYVYEDDYPMVFNCINDALKKLCLSYCAIRNAAEKGNLTVTKREDGKVFRFKYVSRCMACIKNKKC